MEIRNYLNPSITLLICFMTNNIQASSTKNNFFTRFVQWFKGNQTAKKDVDLYTVTFKNYNGKFQKNPDDDTYFTQDGNIYKYENDHLYVQCRYPKKMKVNEFLQPIKHHKSAQLKKIIDDRNKKTVTEFEEVVGYSNSYPIKLEKYNIRLREIGRDKDGNKLFKAPECLGVFTLEDNVLYEEVDELTFAKVNNNLELIVPLEKIGN